MVGTPTDSRNPLNFVLFVTFVPDRMSFTNYLRPVTIREGYRSRPKLENIVKLSKGFRFWPSLTQTVVHPRLLINSLFRHSSVERKGGLCLRFRGRREIDSTERVRFGYRRPLVMDPQGTSIPVLR